MPYNNQPRSHSRERIPGKSSLYNNLLFACAIFLVFTLGIKQKLFMAAKKRSILYTFWWRVSSRVPIKKQKEQINRRWTQLLKQSNLTLKANLYVGYEVH